MIFRSLWRYPASYILCMALVAIHLQGVDCLLNLRDISETFYYLRVYALETTSYHLGHILGLVACLERNLNWKPVVSYTGWPLEAGCEEYLRQQLWRKEDFHFHLDAAEAHGFAPRRKLDIYTYQHTDRFGKDGEISSFREAELLLSGSWHFNGVSKFVLSSGSEATYCTLLSSSSVSIHQGANR